MFPDFPRNCLLALFSTRKTKKTILCQAVNADKKVFETPGAHTKIVVGSSEAFKASKIIVVGPFGANNKLRSRLGGPLKASKIVFAGPLGASKIVFVGSFGANNKLRSRLGGLVGGEQQIMFQAWRPPVRRAKKLRSRLGGPLGASKIVFVVPAGGEQ